MSSPAFLLRRRRRLSTSDACWPTKTICQPLPYSLEALDLCSISPTRTLASIRFIVLSYLEELEKKLSQLESPDCDTWGEVTIEEARQWVKTALEMLDSIRSDVCSHLPDMNLVGLSVESLKSHLPDLPDVPSIGDMRSCLPDMPNVRTHISNVRSRFPDFKLALDDVRTRFHDLDFQPPLRFIPTLSDHLNDLHSHLSSLDLNSPYDISPQSLSEILSELIDKVLHSEVLSDFIAATAPEMAEGDVTFEVKEIANAVKRSLQGVHLISYSDLPVQWRNNPFVTQGYRFIPIERWPLIIMSLFAFHNETLNIHTHLIPFIVWTVNSIPYINPNALCDLAETIFMIFALTCLLSSAIWHTMAGCAHHGSMDLCARIDYVGIGWLISASVGTVVYYGFKCHPEYGTAFIAICFLMGVLGNICPFMEWFNDPKYRTWRIVFFLMLAFSALAPLAALSILHSTKQMAHFIRPVVPSLVSYIIGLLFYALHIPERFLPQSVNRKLDIVGGGSHCIWHCFIVLAVSQHKGAIAAMKGGISCSV